MQCRQYSRRHLNVYRQRTNNGGSKDFANTIFSSYWLIGAYNGSGDDAKSDYFKLKTVSGLTCTDTPGGQGCGGSRNPFTNRAPGCWSAQACSA